MSIVRMNLGAAVRLVDAYSGVSDDIDRARSSLLGPVTAATGMLGRAPSELAGHLLELARRLDTDAEELSWRVDYLIALGGQPLGGGRFEASLPARPHGLRDIFTHELLARLEAPEDLTDLEIALLLTELQIRAAAEPGVAFLAVNTLGPDGLDRMVGRVADLMQDELQDATRAWDARIWDDTEAAKFDEDLLAEQGWVAAWRGPSPGRSILEPLSLLVATATRHPGPPAWLEAHLLPDDATGAEVLRTQLLLSGGRWDAGLLENTWSWLLDLDPSALAIASASVPGNMAGHGAWFQPPIFSDMADPVQVVLAAIGRNPAAAWGFATGTWGRPTVDLGFDRRELADELFWPTDSYLPSSQVQVLDQLDRGQALVFQGASAHLGTLPPERHDQVLTETWPSFLQLMELVAEGDVPGDQTRMSVALLTNWRWPQLARFGPDGDNGSRRFFSELVRNDEALAVLAMGLGSYTQPIVDQATLAHVDGRPVEYFGNRIAFAWQHLFAGLDEAGGVKTEDLGIISRALSALGGFGVKQAATSLGVAGGVPGLVITFTGAEILRAAVGHIVPGAQPLGVPEGDDYFRLFFFPTTSVAGSDSLPIREVTTFQVDVANALLSSDPTLVAALAETRWVVDGRIVAPQGPADAAAFATWFGELTTDGGAAWLDPVANQQFTDAHAEVSAELANQVELGVDH